MGDLGFGEAGKDIQVVIHRILLWACRSSFSICVAFLLWSAAQSSTLPWKVARCCPQTVFALARKASASFTLVS